MRIAIELNNIIRDHNKQVLKYYKKGIDPAFDDESVDLKCTDLLEHLPFENNAAKKTFKEIDYPYELFGCAKTMNKHLHVMLSDWLDANEDIEVIYFTLKESSLMIQSTYFFLSKGSRTKTMLFLDEPKKIWNYCDVAVTLNKEVVDSKPEDKKVIVINRSDNIELQKKSDAVYDEFYDMINDKHFRKRFKKRLYLEIKNKIKGFIPWKKK